MTFNKKNIHIRTLGVFSAYNLIYYLFSHIAYLTKDSSYGIIFDTINLYATKIFEFLLLPLIVMLMFTLYTYVSTKSALLIGFTASAPRIIYAIPFYYLQFYEITLDSTEAIIVALLVSLAVILCTYIFALSLFGIGLLILHTSRAKGENTPTKDMLADSFNNESPRDFIAYGNLAISVVCLVRFFAAIAFETVEAVAFFKEIRYSYTWIEITNIVLNYLLIFALLIVSYVAALRVRSRIMKNRLVDG